MPDSYSVNQLKDWSRCQKKYELTHVLKLGWPSDPKNFRLGKGVHQLLDYNAKGLPLDAMIPDVDDDIHRTWTALVDSRWGILPVIASEWSFSLGLNNQWIYGRIDRIVKADDGTVHILDWKTGTSIPKLPETDWQTQVYLYAVMEAQRDLGLSIAAKQLAFTYVQANKNETVSFIQISYSAEKHSEIRQRLLTTFDAIRKSQQYLLPNTCPDKYCPYSPICGINKQTSLPNQAMIVS